MKKAFYWGLASLVLAACTQNHVVNVSVSNPLALDRSNEMVEVSMEEVAGKLNLNETAEVVILDESNKQVPYQLTYDGKLIFPASAQASGTTNYTIKVGTPEMVAVKACGKVYPERMDDLAWENDRAAYRAYGPALQVKGERAFGYDVFTKSVEEPVVEERYRMELDPVVRAQIDSLRKAGKPDEAKALQNTISYHVDHGNGMDVYNVGPTLGGGTAALYVDNAIVYPYCYKEVEVLDNGPLRFTARLTFTPLTVKGDSNVVETRVITLDAGSQLNKTMVSYTNIKETLPITAGLVLHEENGGTNAGDATKGYIAYADPTNNPTAGHGTIYVGSVFPAVMNETKVEMFPKDGANYMGAFGHVLAIGTYEPDSEFTYYWGSGWSKYGFANMEAWTTYLDKFAQCVRNPLQVSVN